MSVDWFIQRPTLPIRVTLVVACAMLIFVGSVARAAPDDPPCDGWTLHTRTPLAICPEIVVDHFSAAPGMVSIGGLAFDSHGDLYVSRPATGQVMRLAAREFSFDPPKVIADGLTLPSGIACADNDCAITTDTAIEQISGEQKLLIGNLPSEGLRPLLIGGDRTFYTTSGGKLLTGSLATDGSVVQSLAPVAGIMGSVAGIAQNYEGVLWLSDGQQTVYAAGQPPIVFASGSAPTGIVAYPDRADIAFPQFRHSLLVVTSGSWNGLTIAGYELWDIPLDEQGKPGTPVRLIPASAELSSSDASLIAITFYPDHPVAIAIDPHGWIYLATREGRIVRLRPRVSN